MEALSDIFPQIRGINRTCAKAHEASLCRIRGFVWKVRISLNMHVLVFRLLRHHSGGP